MTPEAALFLAKSRKFLVEADAVLAIDLFSAAGRTAYLAAFHAAQALIFERSGRTLKTHNGVRTTFLQLTLGDASLTEDLRSFLQASYNLKAVADYETGPESEVSKARATSAVTKAHRFVAQISESLKSSPA